MTGRYFKYIILMITIVATLGLVGCGGRNQQSLENELAYRQLGIQSLEKGEYEEAVKMFQKALDQSLAQIDELEIDICYYKAMAQELAGDSEGALTTYTALIEYDKENADAYYLRGSLYLEQNQPEKAMKDYEEALKFEKNNGQLYNKMAENLLNLNYTEEAATILEEALSVKGDEAADYREKGYAYYLLGQYENARTYLDKAVNMGDKEAVFYLAKMLEASGDVEQADKLYESYVIENSDDTETLNDLGCARMEAGNYEQALAFFQTALQNEAPVNEQELRRNEIAALEYMQEFDQARTKLESYLKDYPEDEEAAREYEFLKSR